MKENKLSEEVSISPVIRDAEQLVVKIFKFIWSLICWVIDSVKEFFSFCLKNFLLLFLAAAVGSVSGYFSTILFPRQFQSSMTLELNFDSKAQLKNDVAYFNDLMGIKETEELIEHFGVSKDEALSLISCQILPYTAEIEKVSALNDIRYKSDTSVFNHLDKKKLLSQEDDQLTGKYSIVFTATDQKVFEKLEDGFIGYLGKSPGIMKQVAVEKQLLVNRKNSYLNEMANLDTLQGLLNHAYRIGLEMKKTDSSYINSSEKIFDITPLELQNRYLDYSNNIDRIDFKLSKFEGPYHIMSHLNPVGKKIGWGLIYRALIGAFSLFGLCLLVLLFMRKKV